MLVIVLSVLAYVCLILAVCVTLRRSALQIEIAYPLTEAPCPPPQVEPLTTL